jgi:hypothetical protein
MRPTNTNWRNWIATLVLLAVAMAPMAPTTPAVAQQITGLYYKEIEKDGRVYVFNTPERYKSWLESGEMGVAITLVGQGEGGKTLQAENETAADLYFFKHNLEGRRPTPTTAALRGELEGRGRPSRPRPASWRCRTACSCASRRNCRRSATTWARSGSAA